MPSSDPTSGADRPACPPRDGEAPPRSRDELERLVAERTRDLTEAHRELVRNAHRAGMAEMASSVLHNVGNVLTSVGVVADGLARRATEGRLNQLAQVVELLVEAEDPVAYLRDDPRGRKIPELLRGLMAAVAAERKALREDAEILGRHLGHVRTIISTQQNYAARMIGDVPTLELVDLARVADDAIAINLAGLERHGISLERHYEELPPWRSEGHRLLQILTNLISNAKYAISGAREPRLIRVTIARTAEGVSLSVADNGHGMSPGQMSRLFTYGYTTRKDGHGFGLHSSRIHAEALGGRLTAHSDGPGQGAVFTLHLPGPAEAS